MEQADHQVCRLIEKLTDDDELGWATYNRGKPITPRQMAKQLDVYGIKPKTVRQPKSAMDPHGSTPKGYYLADFKDAFARYLKTDPAPSASVSASPAVASESVTTVEEVAETPQRPTMLSLLDAFAKSLDADCGDVADTSAGQLNSAIDESEY